VDVLREEGMHHQHGDLVVTAITQALQEVGGMFIVLTFKLISYCQSFNLALDRVAHDAAHTVLLAKLLVSCLQIRGAQLSIIRRLDNQCVVRIHTLLLTWIGKRLEMYEKNKNKKSRQIAILFFRVLLPLVTVESSDALKM
jgi:cohesin complex subunit SA-1/2